MPRTRPKIVVIGGGTGSFTLLSALKQHAVDLTVLVNMGRLNGGSSGILRDELGVLPPGRHQAMFGRAQHRPGRGTQSVQLSLSRKQSRRPFLW